MTCTRPEAISSFIWCVCVRCIIIILFSFFLTFCFIAECVSVLSLAVSLFLNSVRAVGKFNQAGGEMKCLTISISTHII